MLKKILLATAGVALVWALISYTMYSGNITEEQAVSMGYTLNGQNHDHVKDVSVKLNQANNNQNGVNIADLGSVTGFIQDERNTKSKKGESDKKVPSNIMNSKAFEASFFNATNSDWEWKQWYKEGVIMAVSTDKPVYRPGDKVDIRAYYFNYTDKAPVKCEQFYPNLEIIDSKDEVIFTQNFDYNKKWKDNSHSYEYMIPQETKGGVYYVRVNDYNVPTAVVKIRIRDYQQKSIVKLDYSQESFNPGDEVTGKLTYELVDNTPMPHGAYFELTTSAGHKITNLSINSNGNGFFNFKIPADWSEGNIFMTFTLHVGSKVETKSDIVTVVEKDKMIIEFTGESGQIVNNVLNKIFFECFTDESRSEHADISNAQLVETNNGKTSVIAQGISTMFSGRGYFDFVPQSKHEYVLQYKGVDHPINIEEYNKSFELEDNESIAQVLIKTKKSVLKNDDILDLSFIRSNSGKKLDLMLVVSQKTHILYSQKITLDKEETTAQIDMKKLKLVNGGVISISLYDGRAILPIKDSRNVYYGDVISYFSYKTIAERLVFVLPNETLQVNFETDKKIYSPGQEVKYDITVTDKKTGKQVSEDVFVAVSVTDLSAFLQVENKKQPPSLVSKVYLEKEVNLTSEYEFLNANEYLNHLYQIVDNQNDVSEVANLKLELLLGTQKWRLFMFDPVYKQTHNGNMYGDSSKLSESQASYSLKNLWIEQAGMMFANAEMADAMPMMAMAKGGGVNNDMRFKGAVQMPVAAPPPMAGGVDVDDFMVDEESEEESTDHSSTIKDVIKGDGETQAERVNFKETQLFTRFLKAKKGKYSGSFKLSDLITKFQVSVDAVSSKGVYGALTTTFDSNKEFYIESKIPLFLTNSDRISVPIVITNNKAIGLVVNLEAKTSLSIKALEYQILESPVNVPAHSTKSVIMELKARQQTKDPFTVTISAKANDGSKDSFTKKTRIIGRGFPVLLSNSGFLGTSGDSWVDQTDLDINLAPSYEPGTLESKAKIFTSQLSHIHEALEKLIRDPNGCFEQTSSTTYPLVMALLLMQNLPEKTPEVNQMMIDGKKKLQAGYDRLLTFETKEGGYEWFGEAPGHEALSAYGLMQFHEMKEVLSGVDQSMIDRVTDWVLKKRDGKGSFKMSTHGLDSFGSPPPDLSDAYILWVLTSIGKDVGLEKEIKMAIEKAKASGDTYLNALVANILYNVGRDQEAKSIAKILASHQDSSTGEIKNSETSITRSSGSSLAVETTALCNLAWMKEKSGDFASNIELGVKYIVASIKDGKYGSTQGTILSLKVLVEFLKNSKLQGKGTFEVLIDNISIKTLEFSNDTTASALDFSEALETYLNANQISFKKHSNHKLTLKLKNFVGDKKKFRISYSIQALYKDLTPTSNEKSDLEFTLGKSNDNEKTKIGDIATYNVSIHNKDTEVGKGMLIAMIRIPSWQEVDYNWLERLQSSKKIAYFEVFNDNTDVVLYWRSINPNETKQVDIQMSQVYSYDQCIYRPSQAYLYYDEDGSQVWTS